MSPEIRRQVANTREESIDLQGNLASFLSMIMTRGGFLNEDFSDLSYHTIRILEAQARAFKLTMFYYAALFLNLSILYKKLEVEHPLKRMLNFKKPQHHKTLSLSLLKLELQECVQCEKISPILLFSNLEYVWHVRVQLGSS